MGTIKEAAETFEPKRMKNVADLEVVDISLPLIENEKRKNQDGEEYLVSYFIKNDEEYRIPPTVLEQLKVILKSNPDLKSVKVNKTGEGKTGTKYQVIQLG